MKRVLMKFIEGKKIEEAGMAENGLMLKFGRHEFIYIKAVGDKISFDYLPDEYELDGGLIPIRNLVDRKKDRQECLKNLRRKKSK